MSFGTGVILTNGTRRKCLCFATICFRQHVIINSVQILGVFMPLQKTDKIWHKGKLIRWEDATIHVMSHVIHYGSSVFEGVRCYAPPSGPAIFRATEHIERLLNSAKVYRIDVDYTRDQIIKAMLETVASNGTWPCYIRPVILRGYGEAGVNPFNSPTEV